jgi:hypothetical protein
VRVLVLGPEAIVALSDPGHPHHREVLAFYEANRPARRGNKDRRTVVPVSVRVAVGWDRTTSVAGPIDRLNLRDVVLDRAGADRAADVRRRSGASPIDAALGAALTGFPDDDVTVLTGDPEGVALLVGDAPVNIQAL